MPHRYWQVTGPCGHCLSRCSCKLFISPLHSHPFMGLQIVANDSFLRFCRIIVVTHFTSGLSVGAVDV